MFSCQIVSSSATPLTEALQEFALTISWSLPKFISIESVMLSNHLILCHPLLLLLSVFPSIRDFPSESAVHISWPNIGASASVSVLPVSIQGWFSLGLTGLINLELKKKFSESIHSCPIFRWLFLTMKTGALHLSNWNFCFWRLLWLKEAFRNV